MVPVLHKFVMINGMVIGYSETGLWQGDTLGSMLYAMGIQIILLNVKINFLIWI